MKIEWISQNVSSSAVLICNLRGLGIMCSIIALYRNIYAIYRKWGRFCLFTSLTYLFASNSYHVYSCAHFSMTNLNSFCFVLGGRAWEGVESHHLFNNLSVISRDSIFLSHFSFATSCKHFSIVGPELTFVSYCQFYPTAFVQRCSFLMPTDSSMSVVSD